MAQTRDKPQVASKAFPVIEVFGPTIQGEGLEAGLPCVFVRLGGCDYWCSWCDTMHAVDPAEVRTNAERLDAQGILAALAELEGSPDWVILSGGNPALHELGELVDRVHAEGRMVAVETQGSVWRDWLDTVDRLTVSPKPPSSGMASDRHLRQFNRFAERAEAGPRAEDRLVLKIVVFDEVDLEWAKSIAAARPWNLSLSAGTPVPAPQDLKAAVADRYRWLCERVAADADLTRARVLPQLHVIAWGDQRGV